MLCCLRAIFSPKLKRIGARGSSTEDVRGRISGAPTKLNPGPNFLIVAPAVFQSCQTDALGRCALLAAAGPAARVTYTRGYEVHQTL